MPIPNNISIKFIHSGDQELISLVADWYYAEWKIPKELTFKRTELLSGTGIPFHLMLQQNGIPVATGGLYNELGLHQVYPEYKKFKYWLALLYTIPEKRKQGLGSVLCNEIEKIATENKIEKMHLFTNSAEKLYLEMNWKSIARVDYKNLDTVIMEKEL